MVTDPRAGNEARYDRMAPYYARLLELTSFGLVRRLYRAVAAELSQVDERDAAERLSTLLLGAANQRDPNDTRLRIDVIYGPSRERLKVVVVGTLAHSSAALALITTHLEQ